MKGISNVNLNAENIEYNSGTVADKLDIKGLMIALGQASLMKENPIYSGTLSMNAIIKGKLDNINPIIKLNIANLDLKNIPSDLRLKAPSTTVDITSDGKTFGGNATSSNVKLINPALNISANEIKANITPDAITFTPATPVMIEKNKTFISGKITDYLTEKIRLDFTSTGEIKSYLKGDMNIAKQTLDLVYGTNELSSIILPFFDKSKVTFRGKINITGNMSNPIISGSAAVPLVSIPEIPVKMSDMDLKLNGTILHGSGTVKEFASGGIKAENLSVFLIKDRKCCLFWKNRISSAQATFTPNFHTMKSPQSTGRSIRRIFAASETPENLPVFITVSKSFANQNHCSSTVILFRVSLVHHAQQERHHHRRHHRHHA